MKDAVLCNCAFVPVFKMATALEGVRGASSTAQNTHTTRHEKSMSVTYSLQQHTLAYITAHACGSDPRTYVELVCVTLHRDVKLVSFGEASKMLQCALQRALWIRNLNEFLVHERRCRKMSARVMAVEGCGRGGQNQP